MNEGYVQPIEGRGFLPGAQGDGARKVASTISLVQGEGLVLISDPGMAAPGVWSKILEQLEVKGIQPTDVTHVFISHHHPDHITQLGLFPNAILVDFWATYKDDVWSDHPDNYEIAPGVIVVRTPGHTDEDASLLVETLEGTYALTHLWWVPGYEPLNDPLAEDADELTRSRQEILLQADWIVPGHGDLFRNTVKAPAEIISANRAKVLHAVEAASAGWQSAFNSGDAAKVADFYETGAVMNAQPFGTYTGRRSILRFWAELIAKGFQDVRYENPKVEVVNENAAIISADWEMNNAYGVITKELWVLQEDGTAKLRSDNFEVLGEQR